MSVQATQSDKKGRALATETFRYAVVDLASAERLRPVIAGLRPSVAEPLLARNLPQKLLRVGPWLVRMSKAPDVEKEISDLGSHVPWGYFVHSTFDIISLRRSLRRFNLARLPGSQKAVLFRYWDPRVMLVFLNVATSTQRSQLFDLVERIEAADGSFDANSASYESSADIRSKNSPLKGM